MHRQELVQSFILAVEQERIRMNLTQEQMAAKLELSTSGYKKIIGGNTERIDLYTLYLFLQMCDIINLPLFQFLVPSPGNIQMIQKYHALSASQKNFVDSIIEFESFFTMDEFANDKEEWNNQYITTFIPIGECKDGMIYDSSNYSKVNVASYRKIFGDKIHFGITINSNHLHPVYHNGDILLVSKEPIRIGDIGIFIHKPTNRIYIRKLIQDNPCVLEPINGFGVPITIDPADEAEANQWLFWGHILTKMRVDT